MHETRIGDEAVARRAHERWVVRLTRAHAGRCPEPATERRFVVDHISCWRVERGEASIRTPRAEAVARAGEWLIAGPGERWITIGAGTRLLSITFVWRDGPGRSVVAAGRAWSLMDRRARGLGAAGRALARTVVEELSGTGRGEAVAEGEGTVSGQARVDAAFAVWRAEFWEMLRREGRAEPEARLEPRLKRALAVWEPPRVGWSLADAARAAGVSAAQLRRICGKALGRSPAEHCRERLAEEVVRRLGEPGATVKAVAHELGFRETQHFSHWVRARFGTTPRALMRDLVGGDA